MLDEPLIATLPAPETKIEHLIAQVPALDVPLDIASAEQVQAADEVFQEPPDEAHNVAGLIGMVGGMMMLHNLAVETIHDVKDLEGHMQREKRKKKEENEE